MPTQKSVAFFGASGGSTAPCLAACLRAGYTCTALVRNANKLTTLLETSHSIPPSLISAHLTIITGDVKDLNAVIQTLFPTVLNSSNHHGNKTVDIIVSGIGCYPVMKKGHWLPQQEDPTLCEDAVTTILNALRERDPVVKPGLVVLSTVGLSKFGRDVPLVLTPVYALLHEAHADKKKMEDLAIEAAMSEKALIGQYFVVRASLLTDGAERGVEEVRVGIEDGAVSPVVGYTISRADVGGFLFEKIVKGFESGKEERTGKVLNVTY